MLAKWGWVSPQRRTGEQSCRPLAVEAQRSFQEIMLLLLLLLLLLCRGFSKPSSGSLVVSQLLPAGSWLSLELSLGFSHPPWFLVGEILSESPEDSIFILLLFSSLFWLFRQEMSLQRLLPSTCSARPVLHLFSVSQCCCAWWNLALGRLFTLLLCHFLNGFSADCRRGERSVENKRFWVREGVSCLLLMSGREMWTQSW